MHVLNLLRNIKRPVMWFLTIQQLLLVWMLQMIIFWKWHQIMKYKLIYLRFQTLQMMKWMLMLFQIVVLDGVVMGPQHCAYDNCTNDLSNSRGGLELFTSALTS